jgi:GNAT superfamily N-acetyltransferase
MSGYFLREVDSVAYAVVLRRLNALEPRFPPLEDQHLEHGHWWLGHDCDERIIGFAGLVPFVPFVLVGYLKRALVLPPHRGQGLQRLFLAVREAKARSLGWTMLVTECVGDNLHSQQNLERAGYARCVPEQRWGEPGSVYFVKTL